MAPHPSETPFNENPFDVRRTSNPAASSRADRVARLSQKRPSLSSQRDRQRLRERTAAERARVERMLAGAPVPTERRHGRRTSSARPDAATPRRVRKLQAVPEPGCPVCASTKTVADEVFHLGTLRLSECLHCEHRWTERPRRRWAELGATMARGQMTSRQAPRDPASRSQTSAPSRTPA